MRKRREKVNIDDLVVPVYVRRLRNLREDRDLTQASIAEVLSVSQRVYADYELGRVRIPVDVLIALAKYYDVDMNYICGVSDRKQPFPG